MRPPVALLALVGGSNKTVILREPQLGHFNRLSKLVSGTPCHGSKQEWRGPVPEARHRQGKPVRTREFPEGIPADIRIKDGKPEKIKHFWAFVVWNYATKSNEILEITQATIQNAITALVQNEDWGDPREYDITITKTGANLDTEYTVMPGKQMPVNPVVKSDFEKKGINLEALYDGANPFEGNEAGEAASDVDPELEAELAAEEDDITPAF